MPRGALLVLDANVLIDYVHAERSILKLAVRHLGDIFVPEAIRGELGPTSRLLSCALPRRVAHIVGPPLATGAPGRGRICRRTVRRADR